MTPTHAIVVAILWAFTLTGSPGQNVAISHGANTRIVDLRQSASLVVRDKDVEAIVEPAPTPGTLRIRASHSGRPEIDIRLPDDLAQVDELALWKEDIVIRGLVNNAIAEVIIVDKHTGQVVDTFDGYWPSLSLKTGLLVFSKEYPIHFADGTEDHYMLYRLGGSPADNRSPGGAPIKARPVGIPLYPLSVGNQNFDNVNLPPPWHTQLAAGFFWNEEGDEVVTLDGFGESYSLVLIQFGSGSARVRAFEVSRSLLCSGLMEGLCRPDDYLEYATFGVDKDGNETVVATFGYPQKPPGTVVTVPISKFVDLGTRSLVHPQWSGVVVR